MLDGTSTLPAGSTGVWWEPAVTGGLEARGLFDANRNALPALTVFDRFTRK